MLRPEQIEISDQLDQYEIKEHVFSESCTNIYRALDKKTQSLVLFAIYNNSYYPPNEFALFLLSYLNTPLANFVKILMPSKELKTVGIELTIDSKSAIAIFKDIPNGSLFNQLSNYKKNGPVVKKLLNPTNKCKIIFGIASLMKKLHNSQKILEKFTIYNIFLDENVEPKIIPFLIERDESSIFFR